MLKRFSVKGFRNFANELTLDFSDVHDYRFNENNIANGIVSNALVIGRNAAGKTNLARAILDIKRNFEPRQITYEDDSLFLNASVETHSAAFTYLFQFEGSEVMYSYSKAAPGVLLREKLEFDGETVFDYVNKDREMHASNLTLIGADSINWRYDDDYLSLLSYITSNIPTECLGIAGKVRDFAMGMHDVLSDRRDSATIRGMLKRVISQNKVGKLEEFLNRFNISCKLKVETSPDGLKSVYFDQGDRLIPFAEACSSGTETLLYVFTRYAMDSEGTLFFLDEFDAYCHFELAEALVRYFGNAPTRQTICSTHNTSLLRNETMRPDCIFMLTESGSAEPLCNLTNRELRTAHNIEKLYRNGEFGR